jgi:hypothetical protein
MEEISEILRRENGEYSMEEVEEQKKRIIKYLGSRGWYLVYLITPDKYPELLSLMLNNNKELVEWFRPVLKFLPFLRAGYTIGVIMGCHLARCITALGWWQFRFYGQVYNVFIPPSKWGDGSWNNEWIWVVKPRRYRVYCTCRRTVRQGRLFGGEIFSPFLEGLMEGAKGEGREQ